MTRRGHNALASLLLGFSFLLSAISLAWLILPPLTSPTFDIPITHADECTDEMKFRVMPERAGIYRMTKSQFRMEGDGWIESSVCSPGTLTLHVRPEILGTTSPTIQVQVNNTILLSKRIDESETLSLKIPHEGIVSISYLDDEFVMAQRIVTIREISLNNATCSNIGVSIRGGSGGWYPESGTLSFYLGPGAVLKPCAAGELNFLMSGQSYDKTAPLVRISYKSKAIQTINASTANRRIVLKVGKEPVSLELINPSDRIISNRNLIIENIKFSPTL